MDATRHYRRRWESFHRLFLQPGTDSPLGTIKRTWWRQEDQARTAAIAPTTRARHSRPPLAPTTTSSPRAAMQARGSLHVHMAIWVEGDRRRTVDQLTAAAARLGAQVRVSAGSAALAAAAADAASLKRAADALPSDADAPTIDAAKAAVTTCAAALAAAATSAGANASGAAPLQQPEQKEAAPCAENTGCLGSSTELPTSLITYQGRIPR